MLTQTDYQQAADILGCEVATIKAVTKIESNGGGFLPDGKVKILFEPHIFYRLQKNPIVSDICYQKWKPGAYGKPSEQHAKLQRAMLIDRNAALKSCSWGLFQIMGFNHLMAGYGTVQAMVEDYGKGEPQQINSFSTFIIKNDYAKYLIRKDWATFARLYNGAGYKANKYDLKLADAYKDFS